MAARGCVECHTALSQTTNVAGESPHCRNKSDVATTGSVLYRESLTDVAVAEASVSPRRKPDIIDIVRDRLPPQESSDTRENLFDVLATGCFRSNSNFEPSAANSY